MTRRPLYAVARLRRASLLALAALLLAGCEALARPVPEFAGVPLPRLMEPERLALVDAWQIDEASGLAASRIDPGRIWLINDGSNPENLFAVGLDGRLQATLRLDVDGETSTDWEDLASFRVDGTAYLLVADIGNNHARRQPAHLYLLREPELPAGRTDRPIPARVVHTLTFTYPDGPRDAESMAVDPVRREILILSKREAQPRLYRLPLRLDTGRSTHVAERLGGLAPRPAAPLNRLFSSPLNALIAGMPTALDISEDGRSAVILTYNDILLLRRGADEGWGEAIGRKPLKLAEHTLRLAEGAGFSADGRHVLFVSEFPPAPLWRVALPTAR